MRRLAVCFINPLQVGLDKPQQFVCAARNLGEQIGSIGVVGFARHFNRLANRLPERGQCAGQGFDVPSFIGQFGWVLMEA